MVYFAQAHERRSLLYRYAAAGYVGRPDLNRMEQIEPFKETLSPLARAICEPPCEYESNPPTTIFVASEVSERLLSFSDGQLARPDIVALLLKEEEEEGQRRAC